MDPSRLPWDDIRPDPVAERDRVLAAARARLPEIENGGVRVLPFAAPKAVDIEDERVAALERELATSEASRAELIERLQRAERSLAETQLRALEAERKASTSRIDRPAPAGVGDLDDQPSFAPRPRLHLHPSHLPEPAPSKEPSPILASLRERISELRSTLEEAEPGFAVEEPLPAMTEFAVEEPIPAVTDLPGSIARPEDAEAFRERLSRAAGARHRLATE